MTQQPGFRDCLRADLRFANRAGNAFHSDRSSLLRMIGIALTPGGMCCLLTRIAQQAWRRRWHRSARILAQLNFLLTRARIAPDAEIAPGLYIPHPAGVIFDGFAGSQLRLFANAKVVCAHASLLHAGPRGRPVLGNNVQVGAFATVYGPVKVGNNVRLGPNTLVAHDLPDDATLLPAQWTIGGAA